jgi:hypothetical protein
MQCGMATGDAAVTVLLAEYNALRAEIDRRSQAQQTLSNLALTLSGALVAYAIAHDSVVVLVLQPIVASALGLLYADHSLAIRRASRYLDRHLAVTLARLTKEPDLLLWEGLVQSTRTRAWRPFWLLPPLLVFVGSSVAVLAVCLTARVYDHAIRGSLLLHVPLPVVFLLWLGGVFMTALAAIGFFAAFRAAGLSALDEALDAAQRDRQP